MAFLFAGVDAFAQDTKNLDHIDVGIILLEQHHLMITVTSRAA